MYYLRSIITFKLFLGCGNMCYHVSNLQWAVIHSTVHDFLNKLIGDMLLRQYKESVSAPNLYLGEGWRKGNLRSQ